MVKNVKNEKDLEKNKNKLNDIFKTLKSSKETGDSKGKIIAKGNLAKEKEVIPNYVLLIVNFKHSIGLPFDVTESDIKQLFSGFNLSSVHFITRRNKPLGSCYVYLEENEAKDAIKLLNGKFFKQKFIITH
ncbi:uncharacterized protein TA03040 [Theileria annulata]|uniref:RRM domain-containing protein n=1 Tax=Theileria annulata TaxID=5874 RepID=Q4UHG7_THEAN|nr:uncharacterized protein TA03040 [Theileria annulata]CAI73472.1 hypothetical protein, conserved [Theileria annulata]|eukprot:XP_954149.1 hypothetical protein, conserved [Theileria annulata]